MSKHDLQYQLISLCRHNRDGSYATQSGRQRDLTLMARQLRELGYTHLRRAQDLRGRHVEALAAHWVSQGLSAGTIKNRMRHLRWWADKIDKASMIARDNAHYGIGKRSYTATTSKVVELSSQTLQKVSDPSVRLSLELQRAFGLRREEAIKFQPRYADQGTYLRLKSSWTKGGRARDIPIRTEAQRELLTRVHTAVGGGSLIPPELRYVDQLRRYEHQVAQVGLLKPHGLRHAYAQERYHELTGWQCPVAGGPSSRELPVAQRESDREARLVISAELGHGREQITTTYLGR